MANEMAASEFISDPDQRKRSKEGDSRYPDQPEGCQEGISCVPQLQTALKSAMSEDRGPRSSGQGPRARVPRMREWHARGSP